ncbi:hypothetical protein BKA65DRAFT_582569 [Rhexocercosporidium sp. MPI-PUGE-AT-0058]|nr:hypothetical protein BKA65DRAFT_582569 [Rhexocercosporidium sp. MPI-PUGE-AT-0058]
MREWFQNSMLNHPECRKTTSGVTMSSSELHKLPTRVVDIGPSGSNIDPHLINTSGYPDGNWVTLSHYNITERLDGIPMSSMPKSFVDAIAVTKALALRYIWIDSLCIIQEDEEDWVAESKHMGSIYEKAVLTVAASSAEDSRKGLCIQ